MSSYSQFVRIAMPVGARLRAEAAMHDIDPDWRADRPMAWAGLAAEEALAKAYTGGGLMSMAPGRAYDLEILHLTHRIRIEVKTRTVDEGWSDPRLFEWLTIPTHDGRAPIKDVDMVFFCWFTGGQPNQLWALGYLAGLIEFRRRSTFYAENQPLPRGGWAPKGGAYCLEVKQLRPFPKGMFHEQA